MTLQRCILLVLATVAFSGCGDDGPPAIGPTGDISPQWQIETDHEKTSEVEVRFVPETPERTRVELEHRNLDHHGTGWEGARAGVESDDGWPLYLRRFGELLTD